GQRPTSELVRGDPRLIDDGRDPRPGRRAILRERFLAAAAVVVGFPRVAVARRVLDRFAAVDGGLLAAGIAYNAVLALIPIGLFATGFAGFLLKDAASRAELV